MACCPPTIPSLSLTLAVGINTHRLLFPGDVGFQLGLANRMMGGKLRVISACFLSPCAYALIYLCSSSVSSRTPVCLAGPVPPEHPHGSSPASHVLPDLGAVSSGMPAPEALVAYASLFAQPPVQPIALECPPRASWRTFSAGPGLRLGGPWSDLSTKL